MNKLIPPPGFDELTKEQRKEICNGCGPKGFGWAVPDTIWLLKIRKACQYHDYRWYIATCYADLLDANELMIDDVQTLIETGKQWSWLVAMRKSRKRIYAKGIAIGAVGYANSKGWIVP